MNTAVRPPKPRRARPPRVTPWLARGFIVVLVITVALEFRGVWQGVQGPTLKVSVNNEVVLEATPLDEVEVMSEADGQKLGKTPLRLLVPEGPEVAVLLHAPGRTPVRKVLPSSGRLLVRLEPKLSNAPKCTLKLPGNAYWRYQTVDGTTASEDAELPIQGSTVVHIMPEGEGAWLVRCSAQNQPQPNYVAPQFHPPVTVTVTEPTGALIMLNESPMGRAPKAWVQSRSFAHIRLGMIDGSYLVRWVATPNAITVAMPISDSFAPRPSLPGAQFAPAEPSYARPYRSRPVAPVP